MDAIIDIVMTVLAIFITGLGLCIVIASVGFRIEKHYTEGGIFISILGLLMVVFGGLYLLGF